MNGYIAVAFRPGTVPASHEAAGRRIVLPTVFRKQRRQERGEIERAYKAMKRCIEETHVAEEDDGETA